MDIDIDKLTALEKEATPGPWTAIFWDEQVTKTPSWSVECNMPDVISVVDRVHGGYEGTLEQAGEDAKFIAAAREAVPVLLAELDRQKKGTDFLAGLDRSIIRAKDDYITQQMREIKLLRLALSMVIKATECEAELPCRVDEMTERELAIFDVGADAFGALSFIWRTAREALEVRYD